MIPGRTLRWIGNAFCSPDMRERVIDAFVADVQREWCDATTPRQRALVKVRACGSFAGIIAGCLMHDVQHDFAGFTTRVLKHIGLVGVALASVVAPSLVTTGHVDWIDTARGIASMGVFATALFIAQYRSRHAHRRAWLPFSLAACAAVAVLVLHPVNDGHEALYRWMYMTLLMMTWPFLRKRADQGPTEAGPHR